MYTRYREFKGGVSFELHIYNIQKIMEGTG